MQFLKNLLKDQPYVEFAFMSGILPIPKYSIGSSLNRFVEYNFTNDWVYESFYGFDEREVKALCMKHPHVPYQELSDWYGGYKKNDGTLCFNPHSVVCALTNGVCIDYWHGTGITNEVAEVIGHNEDIVKEDIETMMKGNSVKYNWCGYEASQLQLNDAEEILCALAVFGFLSYHDHELSIPNKETMEKFE